MSMDFQLTEEQQQLKDSTRRFAREQLPEIAEEIERTGKPVDSKLLRQFADLGFLGVNIPEEFGGMGLGNLEALIVLGGPLHFRYSSPASARSARSRSSVTRNWPKK